MITFNKSSYDPFEDAEACKELFENANDLIQSVDENGRFLYVNKKWRDVLGYTEEEARRMAFPDIIHQNHLQACFEAFAEMQKGKSFDNFRTQFVAKSGQVIDVNGNISVRMNPVRSKTSNGVKDGKFASTWGIFREAVPHTKIEDTLRQEQKFSQALIDSLPSIFYVFEVPSLRMIRWNRALTYIFGFSNEETAKMSPIDFIDEQDKKKVEETVRNVIAHGKDTAEVHVRAKDGSRIPYLFSAVHATIAEKGYIVGIGIDTTDLRKREEELDHVAKTLVRRDFELLQTNDVLRIRDEQIVKEHELNRAKSEFVSLASHQLKTPLTIIKWYIEMLNAGYAGLPAIASAKAGDSPADAPPSPRLRRASKAPAGKLEKPFDFTQGKQKEYLGIIYRNTERMVELIDAFLNVSRLELGVFSVKMEPIDLKDKMELILRNFEPKIKEKNLKLSRIYAPHQSHSTRAKHGAGHGKHGTGQAPSPEGIRKSGSYGGGNFVFAADIKMIQIIFENLVSNAIKYTMPKGEIRIKMSRHKVGIPTEASGQNGGDEIFIEVADTGIGIPRDQQSKIFTKFFRADNATSYKADGSGLGLYIAKTAVEKLGGKIWFRSPVFAPVAAEAKTSKKTSAGKPAAADPVRSLARAKGASPKDLGEATSNGADKNGTAFYVTFYPSPFQKER